jgi:hypothetical protein
VRSISFPLRSYGFLILIVLGIVRDSSSCAITFYLALNLDAQRKLQAELDEAIGSITISNSEKNSAVDDEAAVAPYDLVKSLPYLEACINEGLRIHSTRCVLISISSFDLASWILIVHFDVVVYRQCIWTPP